MALNEWMMMMMKKSLKTKIFNCQVELRILPVLPVLVIITHHYLGISDGVLRDSDPVLLLLPLWRLVVDVGDDHRQIH